MTEKPEMVDPREWLKKKLGEADFADFEEGLRKGADAVAKGEVEKHEVEGQTVCTGNCNVYCANWAMQAGYWSQLSPFL